jgi:phosphohistidine swiveling domain-containing protein
MVYTEIQEKNGSKYYYRTLTIRNKSKFRKFRKYLGLDLSKEDLSNKEKEADIIIQSQSGKTKKLGNKIAFDKVCSTKWIIYHNRGSLIPPLTSASLFDLFTTGFVPIMGDSYNQLLMMYIDGKTIACFPQVKSKKLSEKALQMLIENPNIVSDFRKRFSIDSEKFLVELQHRSKHFKQDMPLKTILIDYNYYYKNYQPSALYGEPFPVIVHDSLSTLLGEILKKAIPKNKERMETLSLLLTPRELSFVNREERDIYSIAKHISKNKSLTELFSLDIYSILDKLPSNKDLDLMINRHTRNYFWLSYDYIGEVWDKKRFVQRLKEILQNSSNLKRNFSEELQETIKRQEEKFSELIKSGKITEKDKKMFLAAQECAALIDLKKEKLSQVHFYINKLLQITADLLGISLTEIVFAHKSEFSRLLDRKMNVNILKQRAKKSAFYFSNNGLAIFSGKEVDLIWNTLQEKSEESVREISGICANPGTIIGKVKLLTNPTQINKISKGDILVTGMTTPEYITAMKKASAIITNEGGITCHAAIISRELGIPCIVGTKVATQVLKDNDLVEIHAANGTIKILKRE